MSQSITSPNQPFSNDEQSVFNEIIKTVVLMIEAKYIDPQLINKEQWKATRNHFLSRSYRSKEEVYSAIREMLEILGDPYTRFLDPQEFELMTLGSGDKNIGIGIGLQLDIDKNTKLITVIAPIDNSPAQKAGIRPKDTLLKVNGQTTQTMPLSKVIAMLRDKPGSSVILTIQRKQQISEVSVMREDFEMKSVRWNIQNLPIGKIGYIRLSQFRSDATERVSEVINSLEQQGVLGYVLDLRSNSGGLLTEAIDIARLWLNRGLLVIFTTRDGYLQPEEAHQNALTQKPLVVLIDEGSAAASELLAAAIQENQRAKLIGTSTFGQNTIQSVNTLSDGSAISLTTYKWLTPKGTDISNKGLIPDVNIKLSETLDRALIVPSQQLIEMNLDDQYTKAMDILTQEIINK